MGAYRSMYFFIEAITVAQPDNADRVGSHRLISCVPKPNVATSEFLYFYFLTPEGLEKIGKASPCGAGRNRTLGLKKLEQIEVPIPPHEKQVAFNRLQVKVLGIQKAHKEAKRKLAALLPSILDKAFKGEL